jgi:hypothetical protein
MLLDMHLLYLGVSLKNNLLERGSQESVQTALLSLNALFRYSNIITL